MTPTEARRIITEAANYLESLSLESNGTDTEFRLSQGLLAAALVIPRAEKAERIPLENGQVATVQATLPAGQWDDETRAKFRRAQGIIDVLRNKADAAAEELEPKRCERCAMPVEEYAVDHAFCPECAAKVGLDFHIEPVAVPMGHVEPSF